MVHKANAGHAALFNLADSVNGATAGGKHGVNNKNLTLCNVIRQFAVVFNGLAGFGVAVKTDVAHSCLRKKVEHAVNHTDTGAENRNNGGLFSFKLLCYAFCNRSFDFNILGFKVTSCFKTHKHCDFSDELAESFGVCFFAAKNGEFLQDNREVENDRLIGHMLFLLEKNIIKFIKTKIGYIRHLDYLFSSSIIISMRFSWRPPSNSVVRNMSTSCMATPEPITRAPRQSTFALLCFLVNSAEK